MTLGWRLTSVCIFLLFACIDGSEPLNSRPIIGILAQDTNSQYGKTYIPATYVKYMEQAGARVVPIKGGQPLEYYSRMVNYTNGILIPGGAVDFATSLIGRSTKIVYDLALQLNDMGDYYPIWGTCMGFQLLCYVTQGQNLLKPTDSNNASWALNLTSDAYFSRMYGTASFDIQKILLTEPVTQNQHSYSILIPDFENSKLSDFFYKLSTNIDRKGVEFISSVEAKRYPIYGTQWHPEKNSFNWNPNYVINHESDAVLVGQYMANFFVSEAIFPPGSFKKYPWCRKEYLIMIRFAMLRLPTRKSQHKFPSVLVEAHNLIQNYKRIYVPDGTFMENFYIDT